MKDKKTLLSLKTKNPYRNNCFAITVIVFLAIMLIVFTCSPGFNDNAEYSNINCLAYSEPDTCDAYMMQTDALAKGQISLDIVPSDELLALENPYDPEQRTNVDYVWDFAFYNGKYYSYFGIAPVILFLLPFRLMTGMYLSSYFFSFFMEIGAIISLAFLYKTIVQRFFKDCNNLIFTFGLISVLFGSNILFLSSRSWFYEIAYGSGLMFTFLSLTMLIKIQTDKTNCFMFAFLSAIFFALSVGCRPNYCIYFIIHIPVMFSFLKKSETAKKRIKLLAVYIIPIMVIGCCLGVFNLMRFNSFFQFGAIYQLTISDITKNSLFDFAKINEGLLRYFLQAVEFKEIFPFIYLKKYEFTQAALDMYSKPVAGLFYYPVVWNLVFLLSTIYCSYKNKKSERKTPFPSFIISMLICCIVMIAMVSTSAGIMQRYATDFQWTAIIASVCTFIYLSEQISQFFDGKIYSVTRQILQTLFCISAVCSIFVSFGIGIMGEFSRIKISLPFLFD